MNKKVLAIFFAVLAAGLYATAMDQTESTAMREALKNTLASMEARVFFKSHTSPSRDL